MLAPNRSSRQSGSQHHRFTFPSSTTSTNVQPHQPDVLTSISAPTLSTPQPQYTRPSTQNIYSLGTDLPLYDNQSQQAFESSPLMQSEHMNGTWRQNGQLTPTSATRAHHRESSLSSLGSAGPSSPYTANTSNPLVVDNDQYHDLSAFQQTASKTLSPAHTPLQEQFFQNQQQRYYYLQNQYTMCHDGLPKMTAELDLMSAPEFNHSARPSITSVASHDSPSTPPSYDEDKQKNVYRSTMPKLDRTMTDVYADELYNPHIQITSAGVSTNPNPSANSPQDEIFVQRLQAANSQHLNAAQAQVPLSIPARGDRSPFRQGSPLAPSRNRVDDQSARTFSSATQLRQRQKAESDAQAFQHQLSRISPEHEAPKTVSPKDIDLEYNEESETPLFPSQQVQQPSPSFRNKQEPLESDDSLSQASYNSMATTRRESSSAFSVSSQPQQRNFNFASPALPNRSQPIPQRYPFVPQTRRQPSNISTATEDFPATLNSMESSSSEYAPELSETQKPVRASGDTGTYTCTYHGCTLRFDTPAKLQRHKREGHRNSAAIISGGGGDEGGMTSAAQRNSQAGPHKCERKNPSTGKPCNTIFSRPYDLTRHEDTIHNARKQKVHCPYCTEEKTFSRNDALTRHLRVVHPEHADNRGRRRGGGSHD